MEIPKFTCSRNVDSSIFEKSNVNNKDWWKRLFEIMVKEVCVPPHFRVEVLEEIFPHKIFESICTLLNIGPKSLKTVISDINIRELASQFSKPNFVTKFNKRRLDERPNCLNSMAESNKISKDPTIMKNRDLKMKAYLKFRREGERKIVDNSSKLSVKAKIITEKIAYEFVRWLKKFEKHVIHDIVEIFKLFNIKFKFPQNAEDSDSSSESLSHPEIKGNFKARRATIKHIPNHVTKRQEKSNIFEFDQILKMFEIGLTNEATNSLTVEIKEIPITGLRKVFELAEEEAALHKRKEEKERMHYFHSLIEKPPVNFCKSNYMKELESMQVTFQYITHLRSVKSYCKWLMEHPEKERPKFLETENMFDMALLSKSDESFEIIDS